MFGHTFQQVPLRVVPPFHFPAEPALIYLINPTAGLLDGDGHRIEINAGAGTRALVTGQSATRIHPRAPEFWHAAVAGQGRGGLSARPVSRPEHPLPRQPILSEGGHRPRGRRPADLGRHLDAGALARIGDLAEHYEFERVVQELEVRRGGELVYRDRFHWEGPWDAGLSHWYLGGGLNDATGSLFLTGEVHLPDLVAHASVRRAVLPLAHGDTLIRWCGPVGDVTAEVVRTALTVAAGWSGRDDAPPWLIGSNHLVPNHWFSVDPGQIRSRPEQDNAKLK